MSNYIEKVAIVGAGGQMGSYIVEALLKTGKHHVTAITRIDSTCNLPTGVDIKKVDSASLVAALQGQDALISQEYRGPQTETIIPSFSAHWISRQLCTIQAKLARKPGSWMRNQCISKESVRSPLDDSMTKEIHQGEKTPVRDDEKHFMKTRHPSFSRGDSLHCSATALQPPAIPTNLKFDIMQRFSCQSMQKGSTSRLSLLVSPR
ncbi:hypothetical protein C8J56DRAFT_1173314 [Mycena floridula]|nr:hypothetical protein C8J56DRAFT_1173314 [Mycena floridula]